MSDNPLDDIPPNDGRNLPPKEEPTALTAEQELQILRLWNNRPENPPSLKELTELCFGAGVDGRDKRAKLIKQFLATRKLKAPVSYIYQKKGELELNDEQKEFIANNCQTMTALEMAETLFQKKLTNLSQESRSVINYVRTLTDRVKYADPLDIVTETYKVPKQDGSMIERINKYIDTPIDRTQYDQNERQKKWVRALIGYVNSYRFVQQINTYKTVDDRELFESSFISYTYGKDDLTPEERDQYIILCTEVVISKNIQATIEKFQRMADEQLDGSDETKKNLSMSLVEAISGLRKEYNDCVKRQQSLLDDLKVKRSKRIQERVKENESLVSLVEYWKTAETRQRLIAASEIRRTQVRDEVKRLEQMESLKFEIFGVDPSEVI